MTNARALQQLRSYASPEWANISAAQEAGQQGLRMEAALRLVLLFHSSRPWTQAVFAEWRDLEWQAGMRDDMYEATTKRLCDVIRSVLGEPK